MSPGKKLQATVHITFIDRLKDAMNTTWAAIAPDLFDSRKEEASIDKTIDPYVMPQDEVIFSVLDFIESYGGDDEVVEMYQALPREEQKKVVKQCMPDKLYGM